jgi:hypothetical protein
MAKVIEIQDAFNALGSAGGKTQNQLPAGWHKKQNDLILKHSIEVRSEKVEHSDAELYLTLGGMNIQSRAGVFAKALRRKFPNASPYAITGLIANWAFETGGSNPVQGLDPFRMNGFYSWGNADKNKSASVGGAAFGLAQWLGVRRVNLIKHAYDILDDSAPLISLANPLVTVDFAAKELIGSEKTAGEALIEKNFYSKKYGNVSGNIRAAVSWFLYVYERPGQHEANLEKRIDVGELIFDTVKKFT